jgi:L-rhamnose mutarotase
MAIHAAMVHRMDIEIGRVLDQIKAMGVLDNTVVLFVSDNGASSEQILRGEGNDPSAPMGSSKSYLGIGSGWSSASNTPFRLHKSWTHEGGITTPFIVNWPAGIKAHNELRRTPGHLIDIVPTLLDIVDGQQPATYAGLPVPPMQGKSLVPDFTQDGSAEHQSLWWCHDGNRALRVRDWKIVATYMSPWELYDLSKDRTETNNLAAIHPDKVRELERVWIKKNAEIRALAAQDLPAGDRLPAVDSNAKAKTATEADAAAVVTEPDYIVVGVKLKLKPGMADEYKRRHDEIWPELSQAIRSVGIIEFSIFLDEETNTLFAMQKLAPDHHAGDLAKLPVLHEWWESMVPLMETNPDTSPVRVPLKTMFHHK